MRLFLGRRVPAVYMVFLLRCDYTILFSLVDSYLITFKIGNVAKYCTIPPPSHSLDNGGKSPGEQFIKHCFLPTDILSCSYHSGFLPRRGGGGAGGQV